MKTRSSSSSSRHRASSTLGAARLKHRRTRSKRAATVASAGGEERLDDDLEGGETFSLCGEDKEKTPHQKVLMSWETDYLRGSKATRGPILYAMEKFPEKLEHDGKLCLYTACQCKSV